MESKFQLKIRLSRDQLINHCVGEVWFGRKMLDVLEFDFSTNFEDMMLDGLDKLLKKNRLNMSDLSDVKILGSIDKNTTTYKVATAFRKGLLAGK